MDSRTIGFMSGSYGESITHFNPEEIVIEFPLSATNRVQIKLLHPVTLEDFNTLTAMLKLAGPGIIREDAVDLNHEGTEGTKDE